MNAWHKSSYSSGSQNCVEASEGERILVRDTQNRGHGHLDFTPDAWTALMSTVRGQ
ncbi:DUF397 domain-containing protein [Nocardiopsis tropica]|uniref:DUF397 domain-containing protein n=1 Tax=Nocardiopsis tropica TaxID=109330 RepID=A0ABU7KSY0_9ACTN|nr:DUF397 domain-containing protein [Nocardiopsis umidischolae]MEE2052401.1 DUF397 domain-containing protein [Nocardiopsis umidischolae]